MSLQKLLKLSSNEIQALDHEKALTTFKEAISERNVVSKEQVKFNVVPAIVVGCIFGITLSHVFLNKNT